MVYVIKDSKKKAEMDRFIADSLDRVKRSYDEVVDAYKAVKKDCKDDILNEVLKIKKKELRSIKDTGEMKKVIGVADNVNEVASMNISKDLLIDPLKEGK